MSSAAPERIRRSRITAACAVCRGKRQKCSGEKPICDQCRLHNEECWWSETKKRGPAKDYLRSLQDRLQETERLLLGVLSRVGDGDLRDVVQNDASTANAPSHQTWSSTMSGQEHWSHYPLTRLDAIRAWESARRSYMPAIKSEQRTVYDPTLEAGARTAYTRQEVASPMSMNAQTASAAPGASMPSVNNGDPSRSYSTATTHTRNDSWPPAEGSRTERDERRYSEETREAGEALFSISNHMRSGQQPQHPEQQNPIPQPPVQAQMQPTSQPWQSTTDESQKASAAAILGNSQPNFPKHLFW
ncbi:C6 finger domain protein [Cercospora zeina]